MTKETITIAHITKEASRMNRTIGESTPLDYVQAWTSWTDIRVTPADGAVAPRMDGLGPCHGPKSVRALLRLAESLGFTSYEHSFSTR